MIILGLVLVTVIVIDGVRRLQRQRRVPRLDLASDDKVSDDMAADEAQPTAALDDPEEAAREAEVNWELPNGGARVVRPATFARNERKEPTQPETPRRTERIPEDQLKPSVIKRRGFKDAIRSRTQWRSGSLRDAKPAEAASAPASPEPSASPNPAPLRAERDTRSDVTARERDRELERERGEYQRPSAASAERNTSPERDDMAESPVRVRRESEPEPEFQPQTEYAVDDETQGAALEEDFEPAPRHDVVTQHPAVERAKRHHVSAARARETLADAEEVIVISVLSRNEEGFPGPTLLHLMLACGLRYSEMGIFHRYETEAEDSELQFSMVNVLKPGVFDLDAMDEGFSTPGVTFLMPLPGAHDTAAAFEAMIETAMVLVRNLGGELKDENRSVMTAQTIEFARQRVQEFERRHRLHRYQAN
ncbi:hypothetical protein GCM10027040_02470 [Halomonas shantousis]